VPHRLRWRQDGREGLAPGASPSVRLLIQMEPEDGGHQDSSRPKMDMRHLGVYCYAIGMKNWAQFANIFLSMKPENVPTTQGKVHAHDLSCNIWGGIRR
jgi:hypothetical protein